MYDSEISHTVLGEIIDRIIPQVKEWQNRPLEALYTIVWLDAMYYKSKVVSLAVYNLLAINK
jgi:putative transposase